jgi:hypothetical protein
MGCTPSKFSRARDERGRREPSRSTLSPWSKKHDINDNGTSRRWEDSNPFSAGYEARRKGREKEGNGNGRGEGRAGMEWETGEERRVKECQGEVTGEGRGRGASGRRNRI